MMKRECADAIAVLVHYLRPDWDVRGIMAALASVQDRDPFLVAHAAVNAANATSNRTPAIIAMDGPHWTTTATKTAPQPPPPLNANPRQPDEVAARGSANARQALAMARAREDDDPKPQPPPRS